MVGTRRLLGVMLITVVILFGATVTTYAYVHEPQVPAPVTLPSVDLEKEYCEG